MSDIVSKEMPKVSVIIPNYNHATYLNKRIKTVLCQNFSDIEVIILDDFSHDNSREVITELVANDSRVKTVFNNKNSGSVFKQWAKGLSLARGKYIWIAESDDYAELDFLSTLVPLLDVDDSIAFAYTNSLIVDEHENVIEEISEIKKRIFDSEHWHHDFISEGRQELRQYLSLQCTVNNASAVLFRRSSIDAVGGVNTSFRYTGDWMMYIKLSLYGNIIYKSKCLNNYREHEVNASKKSFRDGSQAFERQKCFAFIYKSGALDEVSLKRMLDQATSEYLKMQYSLFREIKQPFKMLQMIKQLAAISPSYYTKVQFKALRATKTWEKFSSFKF